MPPWRLSHGVVYRCCVRACLTLKCAAGDCSFSGGGAYSIGLYSGASPLALRAGLQNRVRNPIITAADVTVRTASERASDPALPHVCLAF